MGQISWRVLQRLFDDEPPIKVWREDRGLDLETLADRTGINFDRLTELDSEMLAPNDVELTSLATVLQIRREYLTIPKDGSGDPNPIRANLVSLP